MTERTKQAPIISTYNAFPEKSAIQPTKPPKDNEPVSPIKTDAGYTLNNKYPNKAPVNEKATTDNDCAPPCSKIKIPKAAKNGTQVPAASPSNPSVKLTAFTVAKKRKNVKKV